MLVARRFLWPDIPLPKVQRPIRLCRLPAGCRISILTSSAHRQALSFWSSMRALLRFIASKLPRYEEMSHYRRRVRRFVTRPNDFAAFLCVVLQASRLCIFQSLDLPLIIPYPNVSYVVAGPGRKNFVARTLFYPDVIVIKFWQCQVRDFLICVRSPCPALVGYDCSFLNRLTESCFDCDSECSLL